MRLGLGVGVNDVEMILRSLPSMALRYRTHDENTRILAHWCDQQPAFAQVLHPALAGSPGHANWKALCKNGAGGAAGLFSVVFDESWNQPKVDAFCNALRLFRLGYSWGGPISLVVPYDLASMRTTWPAGIARGAVVRFCVGLEAVEDLQADIMQALQVAEAAS